MNVEDAVVASEFVDHLSEGRRMADRLGLAGRDFVFAASLGLDEHGHGQVLIVGGDRVLLAPVDGSSGALEFPRAVLRSVEVDAGRGLLLRAPGQRWMHGLSDTDAAFLQELFIETPLIPPRGRDGRSCIPEQGWHHEQLARLVGMTVMQAAEAEHVLGLVAAYGKKEMVFDRGAFGVSGNQLADGLDLIGKRSRVVADMAERYRAWADRRNQLVHSIRPMEDGRPGPKTHRPVLLKKSASKQPQYAIETQDLPDIVDMWYAFYSLYHDAWRAFLSLISGMDAEGLPPSNSASGSARMPAHPNPGGH
ncbi:hypothetical protein [Specibacter cremeus]|uniref:hypothetical protein n=1 Tax=Specibacter cremeus TaxID=1629051 RepID=UPI000F7AD453|nr:hypothetical protein [Specibacter cremeus]